MDKSKLKADLSIFNYQKSMVTKSQNTTNNVQNTQKMQKKKKKIVKVDKNIYK